MLSTKQWKNDRIPAERNTGSDQNGSAHTKDITKYISPCSKTNL
jgi:hypothetical protein